MSSQKNNTRNFTIFLVQHYQQSPSAHKRKMKWWSWQMWIQKMCSQKLRSKPLEKSECFDLVLSTVDLIFLVNITVKTVLYQRGLMPAMHSVYHILWLTKFTSLNPQMAIYTHLPTHIYVSKGCYMVLKEVHIIGMIS